MRRSVFATVLGFALLSLVAAEEPKKEEFKLTKDEQAVIDLTNAERMNADLPPFRMNEQLMAAARAHGENMAKQEKLEHVLDDKTHADRAKAAGYKYRSIGENIAWNAKSPKAVVEGWMNSPPHKENILKKEYKEIGVAVAKSTKGETYWVQVFGTQLGKK
jgi:uncharacterized protein YkwD